MSGEHTVSRQEGEERVASETKEPAPSPTPGTGQAQNGAAAQLRLTDVDGLGTLWASGNLEFYFLTFTERFKPVPLDS